ncbi:MAG: 16S rRNA (guanine(966)-N(2))-methyltransferase RsmD [Calditrichales bacterium]|nr:MAG: 16S rRNA (guanine(966)-N(2))-methyltransferase RsmD [Calditrichales bacterium]
MRILAGNFKGKNLFAGNDLSIRPTTSRIKQVIFSVLDDFCSEKHVLDLFAGSGSLGLEALSRGATEVTFVEQSATSIQVLKKNLSTFAHIDNLTRIRQSDVYDYISNKGVSFELILMDPPFRYPRLQEMVNTLMANQVLARKGILVIHHETSNPLLMENAPYLMAKQKKVGRSLISFIFNEENNDE